LFIVVTLILCEIYVYCFAEGMIKVKHTSVHLEVLHELLDDDWKHSIAAIIVHWLTVCIISLLLLPELVICTGVVMSTSGKYSYLLCFQNVFT